jgi:hypothetical protein
VRREGGMDFLCYNEKCVELLAKKDERSGVRGIIIGLFCRAVEAVEDALVLGMQVLKVNE